MNLLRCANGIGDAVSESTDTPSYKFAEDTRFSKNGHKQIRVLSFSAIFFFFFFFFFSRILPT